MPLYEKNSARIDARKVGIGSYEHTLSTVWDMSLSKVTGESRELLSVLAYFQPDAISEEILSEGSSHVDQEKFGFFEDEMR